MSSTLQSGFLFDEEQPSEVSRPVHFNLFGFVSFLIVLLIFITFFILIYCAAFTSTISWGSEQVLFFNDIHINTRHNPNTNNVSAFCSGPDDPKVTKPYKYSVFNCDSSPALYKSALNAMKRFVPKPSMIIFGGDSISYSLYVTAEFMHDFWYDLIKEIQDLYPGVPVIPVLGNNEFVPNYGQEDPNFFYENDTANYNNLAYGMSLALNEEELITFKKGGYYYRDFPDQKLRLICLNTIIYTSWRKWNGSDADPYDQINWYEKVAKEGNNKGYKVGVIMHMPAGVSYDSGKYFAAWDQAFIDPFFAASKRVAIEFFLCGHTHLDMLMPMYTSTKERQGTIISSLSLSPQHGNNPGFKVYQLKKGQIVDYVQYVGDLTNNPQNDVDWKIEYTFSDAYKMPDVSQKSLKKAIKFIQNSTRNLWDYKERVIAGADKSTAFYSCLLTAVTSDEISQCMNDKTPF